MSGSSFGSDMRSFADQYKTADQWSLKSLTVIYAFGKLLGRTFTRAISAFAKCFKTAKTTEKVSRGILGQTAPTPTAPTPTAPPPTAPPQTAPTPPAPSSSRQSTSGHLQPVTPDTKAEETPASVEQNPFVLLSQCGFKPLENKGSIQDDINTILVFDQNASPHCGQHALKNGLVMGCLAAGIKDVSVKGFTETTVIQKVIELVGVEEDATIINLHNALMKLASEEKIDPDEIDFDLTPFRTFAKQNAISLINFGKDQSGNLTTLFCEHTLCYLSNLKKLAEQPGPWTHTFVSGAEGHWITLTAQKDKDGAIKWFGADSYHNHRHRFQSHIDNINLFLSKNKPEDASWWREQYHNAVGGWINRKSGWIDNIKDPSNKTSLLNKDSRDNYLNKIINGFNFIENAELLHDPLYQDDLKNLKKFALVFQKAENEDEQKAQTEGFKGEAATKHASSEKLAAIIQKIEGVEQ